MEHTGAAFLDAAVALVEIGLGSDGVALSVRSLSVRSLGEGDLGAERGLVGLYRE